MGHSLNPEMMTFLITSFYDSASAMCEVERLMMKCTRLVTAFLKHILNSCKEKYITLTIHELQKSRVIPSNYEEITLPTEGACVDVLVIVEVGSCPTSQ